MYFVNMSDYYRNLSLILSRVMDDIGVNAESVMRRRRTYLMRENSMTLNQNLELNDFTQHIFGSQTEGTTTPGLQSDIDVLFLLNNLNVIINAKDWDPGKRNLLMTEALRPGYCKLQGIRNDIPLPMDIIPDDSFIYDENRRVLLKSTWIKPPRPGFLQHGPTMNIVQPGLEKDDLVYAFLCQTLSSHYKEWSSRHRPSNWPSLEMIKYIGDLRCFVVPYIHNDDCIPETDWRISMSLAERFLMFSLNITQIRCYVLLKMIVKTFIEPHVPEVISSYVCKTLLFHCLERTRRDFWIERNLVQCVNHVLLYMLAAVYTTDCPNYFNESANLLLGKIDDEIQEKLLVIIRELVRSEGRFLLKIGFDDLNSRMALYIGDRNLMLSIDENEKMQVRIYGQQTLGMSMLFGREHYYTCVLNEMNDVRREGLLRTTIDFSKNSSLHNRTAVLWIPSICSHLATVDASESIQQGHNISARTLHLYRISLGSDAAASRLKYASFLYCNGEFQEALSVLQNLERSFTRKVVSFCACPSHRKTRYIGDPFFEKGQLSPHPSTSNVAFCVNFERAEIQCCPREMQFEFFRSTEEDKFYIVNAADFWLDLAALDSLPYLYYLQYVTARHLGQQDLKYKALHNLELCVRSEEDVSHRETAYNILGQCSELENNMEGALMYYRTSLQIRPRHNAAKWHVAKLCFDVFTKETKKQR